MADQAKAAEYYRAYKEAQRAADRAAEEQRILWNAIDGVTRRLVMTKTTIDKTIAGEFIDRCRGEQKVKHDEEIRSRHEADRMHALWEKVK